MTTLVEPAARGLLADSGSIKLTMRHDKVKPLPDRDDIEGVRLPEGPYRLMLHCRHTSEAVKSAKQSVFHCS